MPELLDYPVVNTQKTIEHGHRKFVDLHIEVVMFKSYVTVYQRVYVVCLFMGKMDIQQLIFSNLFAIPQRALSG